MTTTAPIQLDLQQAAKEHLWMHFTRMGGFETADVPIIVRGDGCHLEDADGRRYIDALAGLFSVNIGYSYGEEIGQVALEQMRELPFYTNWTYAHPRAIELASEVASLAPGDLNRVFFVSSGSEAVESAWKLARQYYLARGEKRLRSYAGAFAVRMDEQNPGRLVAIKELLGHSRIETTMVYLRRQDKAREMEAVRGLSWGSVLPPNRHVPPAGFEPALPPGKGGDLGR